MAAKSTAIRAPFVSLWSRDDVRTAVCDFLPTKTIAVLPVVAKPLRAAQTPLLVTAIRRRGKTTVPTPPTTRALLNALLVGEPQYFCENWEGELEHWEEEAPEDYPLHLSRRGPDYRTRYLELIRDNVTGDDDEGNHLGLFRRIHGKNLHVTRFRITMVFLHCDYPGGVGYAMLRCPAPGSDIIGPRFDLDYDYDSDADEARISHVKLVWMGAGANGLGNLILVEEVSPDTSYTIDARFRHEVTSAEGRFDVSVNGQLVIEGLPFRDEPLEKLQLYNYSRGTVHVGPIELWYEKAAPDQVWPHNGFLPVALLAPYQPSESESESDSEA